MEKDESIRAWVWAPQTRNVLLSELQSVVIIVCLSKTVSDCPAGTLELTRDSELSSGTCSYSSPP